MRSVVGVVVSLIATVSISACTAAAPETVTSPVPAEASPTSVVRAFLESLDAHDVEAAKRLLSPEFEQRLESSADSWFTNIVSIANVEVGDPVPQVPEGNGISGYQQGVQVLARFDLEQRTVASMHDGVDDGLIGVVASHPWGMRHRAQRYGHRWFSLNGLSSFRPVGDGEAAGVVRRG